MTRIFVYEYLSAGGRLDGADDELRAQGRAMRDALSADLAAIDGVVVTRAEAIATAGSAAPRACESAAQFVAREAKHHDYAWIVAPECDGILAKLRDSVADRAWIGCSARAIRIASSKTRTVRVLHAAGLRVPWGSAGARWVVKPDDGAGAGDTRRFASLAAAREDAARRNALGSRARLEPWHDGDALSLSLLCAGGGAELLSINRQAIGVAEDGTVEYRGVAVDTHEFDGLRGTFAAIGAAIAGTIPGLAGYVGVDVVAPQDAAPVVVEVNPRLTSAYVGLSAALSRNVAEAVLRRLGVLAAAGDPVRRRAAG